MLKNIMPGRVVQGAAEAEPDAAGDQGVADLNSQRVAGLLCAEDGSREDPRVPAAGNGDARLSEMIQAIPPAVRHGRGVSRRFLGLRPDVDGSHVLRSQALMTPVRAREELVSRIGKPVSQRPVEKDQAAVAILDELRQPVCDSIAAAAVMTVRVSGGDRGRVPAELVARFKAATEA